MEPGTTPQAVVRDAHTASRAAAVSDVVLPGRVGLGGFEGRRSKVRRETGMVMHDSGAAPTMV
ncbi:hypothetical protein AB0Q95_24355 [Streptomyces sp. NPDC059900]|uniref:hypothetical protein n=1 Tax=Streptomyces sp. NPDC059900 TaxID=3155816 RepID=UPI003445BCBF